MVSVIIPVFNAEPYLQAALDSIQRQTHPSVEVLAVDDGSTDGSLSILEQCPLPITIIRQQNHGPAAARNRGAREASGQWLAFLDADDEWRPDKLAVQLERCGHLRWSHADSVFVGGTNDGLLDSALTAKAGGQVLERLVCGNFIGTSSVIIERQAFLDAGGFDESLRSIQDWDLWLRVATRHELGYVAEPLVRYRVHPVSVSRNTRQTLPNHLAVIARAFAPGGPAAHLGQLAHVARAQSLTTCSYIAEEQGDAVFACVCAFRAWLEQPYLLARWKRLAGCVVRLAAGPLRRG